MGSPGNAVSTCSSTAVSAPATWISFTVSVVFDLIGALAPSCSASATSFSAVHESPTPTGPSGSGNDIPFRFFPICSVTGDGDRKSTRLNSSHSQISYAVFCLKKKKVRSVQSLSELRLLARRTYPPPALHGAKRPPLPGRAGHGGS